MQESFTDSKCFTITPLSDRSVLASYGNTIDPGINQIILFLHKALQQKYFPGFIESVPAYASLGIFYDVQTMMEQTKSPPVEYIKNHLLGLLENFSSFNDNASPIIKIPVCYDAELGTDIESLAAHHNLSVEDVIRLHTALVYKVYMIGFLPGFAYMGTVDERLITPRKEQPALNVAAGSVGIAGSQTGIYPIDSPGGWQIIGRTPVKLFFTNAPRPCLLAAGDAVQFVSIDKQLFNELYVG